MSHHEILPETVRNTLEVLPQELYKRSVVRYAGKNVFGYKGAEDSKGIQLDVEGNNKTTFGEKYLVTEKALIGSELRLRPESHIRYEHVLVPQTVNEETVHDLIYDRPHLGAITLRRLHVYEPKLFSRFGETEFIELRGEEVKLSKDPHESAVLEIVDHLNAPQLDTSDQDELRKAIAETARLYAKIRTDEADNVDTMLGFVLSTQDRYGSEL